MGKAPPGRVNPAGNLPVSQVLSPPSTLSFFNGNTFAEIGRALAIALFADLSSHRRREASSAVAHFITGVLDQETLMDSVAVLCESADFRPGDRVSTLRGSTRGVVLRLLKDGRVVWQPDGARSKLTSLPEGLI